MKHLEIRAAGLDKALLFYIESYILLCPIRNIPQLILNFNKWHSNSRQADHQWSKRRHVRYFCPHKDFYSLTGEMWPWLLSFIDIYTSDCLQQISKMAPVRTYYLTQITFEIVCNGELLSLCNVYWFYLSYYLILRTVREYCHYDKITIIKPRIISFNRNNHLRDETQKYFHQSSPLRT